jgi:hypothetical protein
MAADKEPNKNITNNKSIAFTTIKIVPKPTLDPAASAFCAERVPAINIKADTVNNLCFMIIFLIFKWFLLHILYVILVGLKDPP